MWSLARWLLLSVVFLLPPAASAYGRYANRCCPVTCCYSPPVICVPAPRIVCGSLGGANVPGSPFAVPRAAPPSSQKEPPLASPPSAQPKPEVRELRYYDAYSVVPKETTPMTGEPCSVGFWNLSNDELTLVISGRTHKLPSGKNLTIDLSREFVWQVAGREQQKEAIPLGTSAREIVIRR